MQSVIESILQLLERGERGALATVVSVRGSVPQVVGARLLLRGDGTMVGTVGGGAVEQRVLALLAGVLEGEPALLCELDLGRDLGMSCGGSMGVFIEPVAATPRLILCGAGHVAMPTAKLARNVGFRVTVIDERESQNSAERFPHCERLLTSVEIAAAQLEPTAEDWILCLGPSHSIDQRALAAFALRPHRYLGLMGSRRKVIRLLKALAADGIQVPLERLYAPVGLALGAESPDEIAVSIVAELVALRRRATPAAPRSGALERAAAPGRDAALGHMRVLDDPRVRALLERAETDAPDDSSG